MSQEHARAFVHASLGHFQEALPLSDGVVPSALVAEALVITALCYTEGLGRTMRGDVIRLLQRTTFTIEKSRTQIRAVEDLGTDRRIFVVGPSLHHLPYRVPQEDRFFLLHMTLLIASHIFPESTFSFSTGEVRILVAHGKTRILFLDA